MNGQQVRDDLVTMRPDQPAALVLPELAFPDMETNVPEPAPGDALALITAILADVQPGRPAITGTFAPDAGAAAEVAVVAEPDDRLHCDEIRDSVPVVTAGVALF